MLLCGSWMVATCAGAKSSKSETFAAESNRAVVCMLFGLVQPGFESKLLIIFLVTILHSPFPAGTPHQRPLPHFSFQVAPPFMSPRFAV